MCFLNNGQQFLSQAKAHILGAHASARVHIIHEYASDVFAGFSLRCDYQGHPWDIVKQELTHVTGAAKLWDSVSYYHERAAIQPGLSGRLTSRSEDVKAPHEVQDDGYIQSIHDATQVTDLHSAPLSLSGKGVRVALVDGGVDYFHPALGGGFGPGFQADHGWDFVGDDVKPPRVENPDPDPFGDCSDHATHTAGILYGNDSSQTGYRGVAPGASVELYRVFDCNGMSTSDVVVRAVLRAYERGVDLVNLSLGSGSRPFPDDPLSALVSRINRAGPTFIVTGAGNSGHDGTWSAAAPEGGGPDVFSVGAVDTARAFAVLRPARATVTRSDQSRETRNLTWKPPSWTAWWRSTFPETIPLIMLQESTGSMSHTAVDEACQELAPRPELYREKVVLIRRGGCTLKQKMQNLVRAGGQYVLIYNDRPGPPFELEVRLDGNGITGAGSLDLHTGEDLSSLLISGHQITLAMDANFSSPAIITSHATNAATAGRASTFSTWGPSGEGHLVPALLAPGGAVLSTLPRRRGGWGVQSGSSMAVPYITGCIALLREAFPHLSARELAGRLVHAAEPVDFSDGGTGRKSYDGVLAPAWQQGAGRVNALRAYRSSALSISTNGLAFNDTEFQAESRSFSLTNSGAETLRFDLSHQPAVTVLSLSEDPEDRYPVPFSGQKGTQATDEFLETLRPGLHAELSLSAQTISVKPGQTATVDVSVDILAMSRPELAARCPLYSGFVKLTSLTPSTQPDLIVPYGGIACQVRGVPTLAVGRNTTFLAAATQEDVAMAAFRSRFAGVQYLNRTVAHHSFLLSKSEDPGAAGSYATMILPTMQVDLAMYTRAVRFELIAGHDHGHDGAVSEMEPVDLFSQSETVPVGGFGRVETVYKHWTGLLPNGSWTSPGEYRIRVSALRLFGDPGDPADYKDHFTTQPFRIAYEEDSTLGIVTSEDMIRAAHAFLQHSAERPCREGTLVAAPGGAQEPLVL